MNVRRETVVALLSVAALVVTVAWTTASVQHTAPTRPPVPGNIITGQDLGFRVEGEKNGVPTGTLVVRIGGVWMEARTMTKMVPLK